MICAFFTKQNCFYNQLHGIQLCSWNLGIQDFWMCNIRFGSYRQKRVFLGYSAPCRQIYVVLCVWDICRSLDQPSKLHHPPLHDLACSTIFSWRKIKLKIFTFTIGLLALLVLGSIHVPSAPRAWPPKNLYNYNRVSSTVGPRKRVCLHREGEGRAETTT